MAYTVVFDITDAGYKSLGSAAFGLIFVAVGTLAVALRDRLPGWKRRSRLARAIFSYGFLAFAVVWTVVAFVGTYRDYVMSMDAIKNHEARVAEGVVTDFRPMPVTGHAMESFCVSGACFHYSDYVVTAGFNNTSSHGGPIHEGLPVRVTYLGNTILKLEIGK